MTRSISKSTADVHSSIKSTVSKRRKEKKTHRRSIDLLTEDRELGFVIEQPRHCDLNVWEIMMMKSITVSLVNQDSKGGVFLGRVIRRPSSNTSTLR